MNTASSTNERKPRRILSITSGNLLQGTGILLGCLALWLSTSGLNVPARVVAMIAGYLLIYFSSHSLTHFLVGRAVGIKFTHYSIGGTSHPATFPALIRPIFENAPFFAVHSDRESLHAAGRTPQAMMFGCGIVGTAIFSTIAALYAYRSLVPGSTALFIFNAIWQVSSLIAETGKHGDLGRALRLIKK